MSIMSPSGPAPLSTVALQGSTAPLVANVSMAAAGTEYSYLLPAGTKQFRFRLRGKGTLQYAWVAGESGGAGPYCTVYPGEVPETQAVTLAVGKIIYFQSNLAAQILEVESWS